ncbi:MAG: hypothetical protein ACI87E_000521 [Mariniblastus sp.]|jgi:hypothetical protein
MASRFQVVLTGSGHLLSSFNQLAGVIHQLAGRNYLEQLRCSETGQEFRPPVIPKVLTTFATSMISSNYRLEANLGLDHKPQYG